jgi:hypothetical protein
MLSEDCVYLWEPLLHFLIHYTHDMHPLLRIQRRCCWQLYTTCRMHFSDFLMLLRWNHNGQVDIARGILGGVFTWRHCRASSGSGGHYFTVVIFVLQSDCRLKMAIVDCFDTVFGVKVKESLWGFIRGWSCSFSKSFQVEGIPVPGCSLEFLEIMVLLFLAWGSDCLCVLVPDTVIDLCH